jgi:hypothetical protein
MPTLSASEYTQYLKFKASAGSAIRPAIQTRDNVSLSQSLINAQLLASQAAFVTTPPTTVVTQNAAVVTDATTEIVTAARRDILTSASGNGTIITYTSVSGYPHGLSTGTRISVDGFTTFGAANVENQPVTVTGPTTFTVPVAASGSQTSAAGAITGRVYYTTAVAHGLAVNDVISITGITTFTASNATVLTVDPATFTFSASSAATTGDAVTEQSGSITGLVYYTTDIPHAFITAPQYITITGLTGTPAYNQTLVLLYRVPTTTTFILQSSATGTAVTGAEGVLTVTTYPNRNMAVTNLARVVGPQVVQTRSNPDARSTVSFAGTSGALGSSRVQQPGGLPSGFKSSTSTYTRLPQSAGW